MILKSNLKLVVALSVLLVGASGSLLYISIENKKLNQQIQEHTAEAKESIGKMREDYVQRLQFLDKVAKSNWQTELTKLVGNYKVPDEFTSENLASFEAAQTRLSNLLAESVAAFYQKKKPSGIFEFKSLELVRELEHLEKSLVESRASYHKSAFAQLELLDLCRKKFMCKSKEEPLIIFKAEAFAKNRTN